MREELTVRLLDESAAPALPAVRWNEEEVSAALEDMLAAYQGRQYTAEEIRHAKEDRAAVNKIEKQLAEAQKRVKALYSAPVEVFDAAMKQYRAKTKAVAAAIDAQVKAVEQAAREDKRRIFEDVYAGAIGGELAQLIPLEKLLDEKWLNASAAVGPAKQELLARIETCRAELETLRSACGEDFAAAEQVYLKHLSIRDALAEHQRLQQLRAAQQRAEQARQAERAALAAAPIIPQPSEEQRTARAVGAQRAAANRCITPDGRLDVEMLQQFARPAADDPALPYDFRAWLTRQDVQALKDFFADHHIRYGKAQ